MRGGERGAADAQGPSISGRKGKRGRSEKLGWPLAGPRAEVEGIGEAGPVGKERSEDWAGPALEEKGKRGEGGPAGKKRKGGGGLG